MSRSKFGLLATAAMVLGLMAITVASAQAKPEWMVAGANITTNTLLPQVQVKEIEKLPGTEVRHLVLLTKILSIPTEILCTAFKLVNVKLAAAGTTTEGKLHFEGCEIKLNGVVNNNCTPKSPGALAGLIETEAGTGTIVLHILKNEKGEEIGKDTLVLVKPTNAEERFVTVKTSEACPIGESIPIKGEFFIKDCNSKAETEEVEHLIEEGPLTHLFAISDTAEHAAKIDGSVWVKLIVSPHEGLKWSGLAA